MRKKAYGIWHMAYGIFLLSTINHTLSTTCYAQQPVSSTDLIERAKELDGQEVLYQGEVVGEIMARGDYCWVNVNDGANAIGIWLPRDLARIIKYAGSFRATGDWIEARGKFNRACPVHGADLDIHAVNLVKIRDGKLTLEQLEVEKKRLTVILIGVMLCLLILQVLKNRLKKK